MFSNETVSYTGNVVLGLILFIVFLLYGTPNLRSRFTKDKKQTIKSCCQKGTYTS